MAKRVPARRVVLWIAAALVLVFIFGQSLLPQDISAEESGWIRTHIIIPLFDLFGMQPPSQQLVRKAAHVFEFTVLAVLSVFCFRGSFSKAFFGGFTVAFLDESLQLLTARGAQLQDVWIDLIGVAVGTLFGLIIRKCFLCRTRPDQNNKSGNSYQ